MTKYISHHSRYALPLAGIAALALSAAPAQANKVADFYKGKTVSIFVGVSPGGIYSTFAQFLSKHMQRHIPGNPEVIVKHMPGAGGQKVLNYVYNVAPKDGTAIVTPNSTPVKNVLFKKGRPKYDPVKFIWLGAWNNTTNVLSLYKKHNPPVKTFEEAKKKEVVIGSIGRTSSTYQFPSLYNSTLGTKFKIIPGYRGGSPIRLAIEKGEIFGSSLQWTGMKLRKPEWIKNNQLYNLIQVAPVKHPDLPNVPLLMDLAKTPDQKVLFKVMSSSTTDRAMVLPPGVPKDRVAALEKAYQATLRDPVFLKDVTPRGFSIRPISAKEITATVKEIMSLPKDKVEKFRELLGLKKKK